MRKIISFMHISLDGFVAGINGEMNWISIDEEIFGHIDQRISQCETAMYGRKTFEMMDNYWPSAGEDPDASEHDIAHSRWYTNVRKIVLSKSLQNQQLNNTSIISEDLVQSLSAIKNQPGSEILLFGSPTATHSLMQHNLIDGYWLFVNPVLLGTGIPLFTGLSDKIKLKLQSTRSFKSGVTELSYLAGGR